MAEPFLVRPLVAVVGGDTLRARELREVLGETRPAPRVELISGVGEPLAEENDEPVVMVPLAAASFEGAAVAFLAGSHASSRKALKIAPKNTVLIDLTSALEDQPNARLRAPFAEKGPMKNVGAVQVIAHPAAIAIAMFLTRLSEAAPVRRSIIHVFEPASERGQKGLDELQQQNVAVLSFQKLKTDVFDTQLAFAMLARYGEEADEPLEGIELRVEKHLASLLAEWDGIPMPSIRVIQAPVFHGHSFSAWVEFEENPGVEALERALNGGGIDVRTDDPPTNIGVAGQNGLSIGGISIDPNQSRACWFWMASDNFRLSAENAVAVMKEWT
ncbi:MAG TPA: Asd/ArgC dimerization domain-containing protein [Bryobacteraceae bacterium]|nr:Asd/ArgC dimerization domain-containing protein [Bryobacteraceae bacterium]